MNDAIDSKRLSKHTFHSANSLGTITCKEFSKINHDLSSLLELEDQKLEERVQDYFREFEDAIYNKFPNKLHYTFTFEKSLRDSKFELEMKGC